METYRVDLKGLEKLAREIADRLKGNEVIFLKGDLGAGKTTFVKFLVQALQPTEEVQVKSPTFAVMNVYPTQKGDVYHLDLYRVKRFDITDYVGSGILLVEWPEYLEDVEPDLVISFNPFDETTREITVDFKKQT
jgi:tRNA threonylcarbamoyladenosine biosynthesis protein TsaE